MTTSLNIWCTDEREAFLKSVIESNQFASEEDVIYKMITYLSEHPSVIQEVAECKRDMKKKEV